MIELLLCFGVLFGLGLAAGRLARCIDDCLEQRRRILIAIARLGRTDWRKANRALELYQAVSYRSHTLALFIGRDPTDLYRSAERRL